MKTINNICKLTINEDQVRFQFYGSDSLINEIYLPIGYKYVIMTFFMHEIPSEPEIEYAINYIEDELMRDKRLLNQNDKLLTEDSGIIGLLHKNGLEERIYSRQRIEELFNQYAYIIMGASPISFAIEIDQKDIAVILILREIMHHLNFENIEIGLLR